MALSNILQKLYRNSGYGPELKPNIIPFASDLASEAADVAASTEWVKTLVEGHMYVDSVNGDDSNDGFSPETPKKTINSALETNCHDLSIAAGTYSENVELYDRGFAFNILGNVTLNGYIGVFHGANLTIYNEANVNYNFVINNLNSTHNTLQANYDSSIIIGVNLDVILNTSSSANNISSVSTADNSLLTFDCGTLTITHNAIGAAIFAYGGSTILSRCDNIVVSSSESPTHTVLVDNKSLLLCEGNFDADGCNATYGCSIDNNSFVNFWGVCVLKGSLYGICVSSFSNCFFRSENYTTIKNIGSGIVAGVYNDCCLYFYATSGNNIYLESYNNTSSFGIECNNGGHVQFWGGGTVRFSGAFDRVILAANFGKVQIVNNMTVSGYNVTGKRYEVWNNGWIYVDGKGVNLIPGTTAGTVKQNELSFYG